MTGSNLAHMLSELRKYKVSLTLPNQFIAQLQPAVIDAVPGNIGTLVAFGVGGKNAPYLTREMQLTFTTEDFLRLPNFHIYLKLMIDGTPTKPFSATTLPFHDLPV